MRVHTQIVTNDTVLTIEAGHDHALGYFINIYDARSQPYEPGGIDLPYAWDQKFGFNKKSLPNWVASMILDFRSEIELERVN